ncbi:dnaJ homolog subfamily C member 10-like [Leptopilina boulardi]|uniref:dnaJ homolog subfamily C member 10-like n=1 Tax=Leptopilina boulardi TaxID=63433 RepID=UPI0021F5B22D|nr:dnaJ homolog subfamily C member 10-like [Leptopilina boulardi]XP_051160918.1 dnaJ homolog subfamily C member 10-like [Leptopilina boulardi]
MQKSIFIFLFTHCLVWGNDYYELLGLQRTADQREIRRAFKKLAVTQHPDKNTDDPKAHDNFVKLTRAYEVLKDPDLRKKYDIHGEEGLDNNNNRRNQYHSWTYYQNNFGIYDDDPQIMTLNRNDYFESVLDSEKMWLVNFYSPMCSHCHHLAPVWRKVAKELEGVIRVAAVNCEDDWQLCNKIGIQSYPTLMHYPKNSNRGARYTDEKSYEAILQFVLDRLDVKIEKITKKIWNHLLKGLELSDKPTLVFVCNNHRHCFTSDERLKVAAIFDKMINIRVFECEKDCDDKFSKDSGVIYFPSQNDDVWKPISLEDSIDVDELVKKILDQLPEPQDISDFDFEKIEKSLESQDEDGWLICFYIGHATELDVQLKKLPSIVRGMNLAKINCGKYAKLCQDLNVNHYPSWGVLKPGGGAFELNHGKNTINDIARFAKNSVKAKNVRALSAEKILSILKRENGNEAWFIDWYAPWCPPCLEFLPELRKASLEFKSSLIHFGTVDCTVHSNICRQYNIRSYPTAMLINGTNTIQFTMQKTASNVIQFIHEAMNPSVIEITSKNFNQRLVKKKSKLLWVVDYFAPWCGPCQQLASEWTSVAKALRQLNFVKIAKINCDIESNLCRTQGIQSYPTIRLYPTESEGINTIALYNGQRDFFSMLLWITGFFPVKVKELTSSTFQKDVLKGNELHLVDFYAPWCGHCQRLEPHYNIVAQLLEGKIQVARINCEIYRNECSQSGIQAYPTLMLYGRKSSYRIEGAKAEEIHSNVLKILNLKTEQKHDEL